MLTNRIYLFNIHPSVKQWGLTFKKGKGNRANPSDTRCIMKTFKFYSANISFNNVSVAVYEKDDKYILQVEKNGRKVKGTSQAEMTIEEYENLPHDPYNSFVRLQAAGLACGYEF